MMEPVSELAPRRRTIMLSGELVSLTAASRPATRAMAPTNTPTTSAMAATVMKLETRRRKRLRRLYLNGIAISIDEPKGIHNVPADRGPSWNAGTDQSDQD